MFFICSYVGFELKKEPNYLKTGLTAICIVFIAVLLSVLCKADENDEDKKSQ